MLPEQLTRAESLDLSRRRQFSFRITDDDSVLQIAYRFNQERILEVRLGFYEVGTDVDYQESGDVGPLEDEDPDLPIRWVRFDYRETGLGRILHTDCHLHLSGLPGTRFAVAGIPTPKQFVEFVVSHFYPETYQIVRLATDSVYRDQKLIDNLNASRFDCGADPAELYKRIPHFRVPGF